VTVAVLTVQNGHAVTLSFLFWQFEAPLALVILFATAAGLVIGGVIGFVRAVRRWSHRQAEPGLASRETARVDAPRTARNRAIASLRSRMGR
jgi:Lipopolysaccharide assembly protein A domain